MPEISKKGDRIPESPIRKLVPYAESAKKRGVKVYHLNIGQPDISSPKNVIEKIKKIDLDILEYSHSAGFESYREGLAKYYRGRNIEVTKDEIIVTTGGSEALFFGFMSCFDEGDEVIVPEPFYANYNSFALANGVNLKTVTASIENGFALPPIEDMKKLISPKTKGILICNPGNPTGYLYTKEELESIRDIVKEYDLFLFSDEVYREFTYDGKQHISIMELEGIKQNSILLDSVSKRYSMCGARIGALVTHNKEVLKTVLKLSQARLSPPTLAQIASEEALLTDDRYFDEVISEYTRRRDVLVEGLNKIEGVRCPNPSGAFYCIVELPVDNAEDFCVFMLNEFQYEGQTTMMAPASGFYSQGDKGMNQVRVAYVLEEDSLKKAVKCIEEGLKAYNKR